MQLKQNKYEYILNKFLKFQTWTQKNSCLILKTKKRNDEIQKQIKKVEI